MSATRGTGRAAKRCPPARKAGTTAATSLRAKRWKADAAPRTLDPRAAALEATARALSLGAARLQGIFDSATDAILTVDARQIIVEANTSAATLFRLTRAELIGAPLDRVIPARFHESHRAHVDGFGADGESARRMGTTQNVTGLRADGEEFPIDAGISHVDVGGERLYTVILRDITQRLRNEAELRESKAQLEAALGSMNDAMYLCDTAGNILELNDAFASFYRFNNRAECRQTLAEYSRIFECFLLDGTPVETDQWALARALRGEVASSVERVLRRRDTGEVWIGSYSFAPIRANDGRIVGAVVSARDITAVREAQNELAASHIALQQLLANQDRIQEEERRRIARELHDDLQQSLAAIRMDTVAVGERIARGHGNVQALLTRIDQLAATAISSTRRIVNDLRPEMLESLGLTTALQALCARHAELTGTECRLELLPGTTDAQLGDSATATGLYRIAQEALNNVGKHAKATSVSMKLGCTHDGLVMLRISDNGIGINVHDKRQPTSFGLLCMAERARAMGGQLRVEGQANAGTSIEVLVPGATPAGPDGRAAPPPEARPSERQAEPGSPLQTVIDALDGFVCVLDQQGVIRMVNRAWDDLAARTGRADLEGFRLGVNYLDVCRRIAAVDVSVERILRGLTAVVLGQQVAFSAEHPDDARERVRVDAASLAGGMAIISHTNLGSRVAPADAGDGAAGLPDGRPAGTPG